LVRISLRFEIQNWEWLFQGIRLRFLGYANIANRFSGTLPIAACNSVLMAGDAGSLAC
jgi:hypothetical protein